MNRLRCAAALGRLVPLRLVVLAGVALLSACDAPPQTGQAQADAEARSACQQRAEQAYNQRNRGEIYSPPPTVNTPYSANYEPLVSGPRLSDLFVHDRMVNDCIRNTGAGSDRTPPAPRASPQ
jgi:hypothetical protein